MEVVLLVIIMLAFFVSGYLAVDRFDRNMDKGVRSYRKTEAPGKKVYITEPKRKRAKKLSKKS